MTTITMSPLPGEAFDLSEAEGDQSYKRVARYLYHRGEERLSEAALCMAYSLDVTSQATEAEVDRINTVSISLELLEVLS